MKTMLLAAAMIGGCINGGYVAPVQVPESVLNSKPRYLCVGMEKSLRFGNCPGCALDAKHLSSLMSLKFGYEGETLISEQATKHEVRERLKKGIAETPENGLFLFFYSGHGGQEYLGGSEPDGADGPDEFLCFYDTYMLDDDLWRIVSQCRGRVFLYFDACHSATMYRSVASELKAEGSKPRAAYCLAAEVQKTKGFTFRPEKFAKARAMSADPKAPSPRILCWSGCKEAEYSYGGNRGGYLTLCVLAAWKDGMDYGSLWNTASEAVKEMEPTQNPVQTLIGGGFDMSSEAFR